MLLPTLLKRGQVDWATLRPFMLGEAPLPSDVLDRLARVLNLNLEPEPVSAEQVG